MLISIILFLYMILSVYCNKLNSYKMCDVYVTTVFVEGVSSVNASYQSGVKL